MAGIIPDMTADIRLATSAPPLLDARTGAPATMV